MKRKIILSLLAVLIISFIGALSAAVYIHNTAGMLNRLINLHQIEDLRQKLVLSIQSVQSDLYSIHTSFSRNLDSIADNVNRLNDTARTCTNCHHQPEVAAQVTSIQARIKDYEQALSFYITASSDSARINELKMGAAAIGNDLITRAEGMSILAASKLKQTTQDAMSRIRLAWIILLVAMILTLGIAIMVSINLINAITGPITTILEATRMISSGDLGYQIAYKDRTEFGELATNFNIMSRSLKHSYAKLEDEITDRKTAEDALIKSESFLSTIFYSIRDPFCIIDEHYRIVRANQAYAHMKGKQIPDLIGKICYETLHGRTAICDDCIVQKTFASGDPCAKEKEEITGDGMKIWRAIFTYPTEDLDGHARHVIEYTHDITGRKLSEEALRTSEERYALAARGANDGLWDWDLRNNKIYYSIRWKNMLGYDEREIGNHPEEWFGRIHPDDREEVEARIAAHLSDRNPHFEVEFRAMHKDGTYRWVLNRGLAVRDRASTPYRMVGSLTDITARKKAEEQLVHDAFHDALTDLPNRALFLNRLQHIITSTRRRPGHLYAVLFLDMDRFKAINDSLGHIIGDQLLVAVGRKLAACVRPGDTVARLGGDEFAILLEDITALSDAVDITNRIHQKLASPLLIKGHEIFTAVSIGIALGNEGYEKPEQVLRDADIAMYQAKARGQSKYEIFDSKMHARILDRLELESDLRGAIEHHELTLFYQPIMNLKTHRLAGFEALVRWNHPRRGMVYPLTFIPLAEENGMIVEIGDWILREACRELSVLQKRYPAEPPLKMSINISSRQFSQPELADNLKIYLQDTGVDPRSIALELTESMLVENVDTAVETMRCLRAMGVHIHIDDFGTGYSSLSYLHRFPINALKIDRSFVNKITDSGDKNKNTEVIQSIISLANSMNFEVIAEGVELEHQLDTITSLQCSYGQGYLFARPMGFPEVQEWLQEQQEKKS